MDKQVMHLNIIFFSHPQSFSPTFCPQKPWPSSLETPTLQSLLAPHFRGVFFLIPELYDSLTLSLSEDCVFSHCYPCQG